MFLLGCLFFTHSIQQCFSRAPDEYIKIPVNGAGTEKPSVILEAGNASTAMTMEKALRLFDDYNGCIRNYEYLSSITVANMDKTVTSWDWPKVDDELSKGFKNLSKAYDGDGRDGIKHSQELQRLMATHQPRRDADGIVQRSMQAPFYSYEVWQKVCNFISITYRNSLIDITKYYTLRTLYRRTLYYEVGYVVQEIITHYQSALELYALFRKVYKPEQRHFIAGSKYALYMYANILNECQTIKKLCGMLHALEKKYEVFYKNHNDTDEVFDEDDKVRFVDKKQQANEAIRAIASQQRQANKRRERERRKIRKKMFKAGFNPKSTPKVFGKYTRTPKHGPFPLHYGWSIENW